MESVLARTLWEASLIKMHFFSFTRHQYVYFEKLKHHLDASARHTFFPAFAFSFKTNLIDSREILAIKHREINAKYANKLHRLLYKGFVNIEVFWVSNVVFERLGQHKPDFIVVWNGQKFHQAITVKVAQSLGIRAIYFENGLLPHTTTMDFKGVNAENSLPRNASFYENLNCSTQTLPQSLEARISKKKQKSFDVALPKQYIFVPFQVAYDTQIIQHSPWIKDMFALFEIIQYLAHTLQMVFVIKEHPSDRTSDYSALHKLANEHIQFSTQNTQTLIENATAILTINSSVALESLLFKKKVIVLGEAFFAIEGIVRVASSKEEILSILQHIDQYELDTPLIEKFLCYVHDDYLIPEHWHAPSETHYKTIDKKLREHTC
jgi:capsular polysaccharide export protein